MTDLAPLRIGVTGSRRYGSPAVIRSAFLAAHDRARPHSGHVLVHGQCDPYHPDTNRPIPWRRAKDRSAEEQGRLLGGDWLAEWVALEMAAHDGITWQIERHPADWWATGKYDRGAGFRRNGDMVKLGADEWEAFALPCGDHRCYRAEPHPSHGTAHCADLAVKARIPLYRFSASGRHYDPHDEEYERYAYKPGPGVRL
jgi:hypothetical protein